MPLTPSPGPAGRRRRAWFGPSRRGWGLWPRAWQGWAVTGLGVLVIAVLVVLAAR